MAIANRQDAARGQQQQQRDVLAVQEIREQRKTEARKQDQFLALRHEQDQEDGERGEADAFERPIRRAIGQHRRVEGRTGIVDRRDYINQASRTISRRRRTEENRSGRGKSGRAEEGPEK